MKIWLFAHKTLDKLTKSNIFKKHVTKRIYETKIHAELYSVRYVQKRILIDNYIEYVIYIEHNKKLNC